MKSRLSIINETAFLYFHKPILLSDKNHLNSIAHEAIAFL